MADSVYAWYAVRVKPRFEKTVANQLRNKGFEEFLPLYTHSRRHGGGFRRLSLPQFPGYLFCRFDARRRLPVLTTPGVLYVLNDGRALIPVVDSEIASVQRLVQSRLFTEPWPDIEAGQRIRIAEGPLRGVEGTLLRSKDNHRLVVSVSLLQRSVAVEVDRAWIDPVLWRQ